MAEASGVVQDRTGDMREEDTASRSCHSEADIAVEEREMQATGEMVVGRLKQDLEHQIAAVVDRTDQSVLMIYQNLHIGPIYELTAA